MKPGLCLVVLALSLTLSGCKYGSGFAEIEDRYVFFPSQRVTDSGYAGGQIPIKRMMEILSGTKGLDGDSLRFTALSTFGEPEVRTQEGRDTTFQNYRLEFVLDKIPHALLLEVDISGVYDADYADFHIKEFLKNGTAVDFRDWLDDLARRNIDTVRDYSRMSGYSAHMDTRTVGKIIEAMESQCDSGTFAMIRILGELRLVGRRGGKALSAPVFCLDEEKSCEVDSRLWDRAVAAQKNL